MAKLMDDIYAFSGKWFLMNGDLYIVISAANQYDYHEAMYKEIAKIDSTILQHPWFWYPRGMCDAAIPEENIANLSGPSLLTARQKGVIASEFEARNMPDWLFDEHYELQWTLDKTPNDLKKTAEIFFKDQLTKYTGRKLPIFLNKNQDL